MNLAPLASCLALAIAAGSFAARVPQFVAHRVTTAASYLHAMPRAWVQPPQATVPTVACGYLPSSAAGFRCWAPLPVLPPATALPSSTGKPALGHR